MLKYENWTLKIYIRTVKHYTDIDPNVDFVFPVNKIDRTNSGKNSLFIVTLWNCPSSLQLLLPLIQTILFSTPRFSIRIKKKTQKLNVFFLVQNRRNFTTQKLTVIRYVITFVSDLRQVGGGFLWVIWFPQPVNETDCHYRT
jgi:hypothetical protein